MTTLDDLELELRKLPGVHAAGFEERDDVLLVQLHVGPERSEQPLPVAASRIAARHSDRPVAVEVVRWRNQPTPPATREPADLERASESDATTAESPDHSRPHRPRLLAVLAFPDTDEVEVHLMLAGRRTIGRAPASSGLVGAVEATIEAIRGLGAPIEPTPRWARALESADTDRVVVAVAIDGADQTGGVQYGLASGTSPIDAAARSTLDALNRRLALVL